jgi:hypothetical protein
MPGERRLVVRTSSDTTPNAEQRQHEIIKKMKGGRRLLLAMAFSDRIRDIAIEGLRRRHSSASESALKAVFIKEMYGISLPGLPERNRP